MKQYDYVVYFNNGKVKAFNGLDGVLQIAKHFCGVVYDKWGVRQN
jgi:hypothetical protein